MLSTPQGEAYIKGVCSMGGMFSLNPPGDKAVIDGCVIITQNLVLLASEEIANSVFTNLYLMNGAGIDYVENGLVFDNGVVKIFKVKRDVVPEESKEELLKWWADRNYRDLIVYDGTKTLYPGNSLYEQN